MTDKANNARPAWTIHPPDIRKALKLARSRCFTLIGVARRNGNQPVVDAFTVVLDKIKEADQAVRDAKALYGWEAPPEDEGSVDAPPRNPCCGNTGTHREGGREYCATCGQELS